MTPPAPASAPIRRRIGVLLSIGVIALLWWTNANKIGEFYDYSIIASGVGRLAQGQAPYVDFVTPLQPLTLHFGALCETLFGPRYLSLAYGNLLLALALFFLVFRLAAASFGWAESLLLAAAVCVASILQHGIIWYNSLGLLWIVGITSVAFTRLGAGELRRRDVAALCLFLIGAGLTKITFLAAGLAIAGVALLLFIAANPKSWKKGVAAGAVMLVSGAAVPVIVELAASGATLSALRFNLIQLPAERASSLQLLFSRELWLGVAHPYYSGNAAKGLLALSAILLLLVGLRLRERKPAGMAPPLLRAPAACRLTFALFFGLALVLTATNFEISSLSETLALVGVVAARAAAGGRLSDSSARETRLLSLGLGAAFLVTGLVSIHYHARLAYGGEPLRNRFPEVVSSGYLKDVRLSENSYRKLTAAAALLEDSRITRGSPEVCWGPGLEILGRVYETPYLTGLPLWFHDGVTIRPQDVEGVVARIESSPARLFIADRRWLEQTPALFSERLERGWERRETAGLVYYVRGGSSLVR